MRRAKRTQKRAPRQAPFDGALYAEMLVAQKIQDAEEWSKRMKERTEALIEQHNREMLWVKAEHAETVLGLKESIKDLGARLAAAEAQVQAGGRRFLEAGAEAARCAEIAEALEWALVTAYLAHGRPRQ